MLTELTVVVTAVARYFLAYEGGIDDGIVNRTKFYFSHHQACIFAKEFIYFERMIATANKPTCLLDDTWFAKLHQLLGIFKGYFLFKLIARQTAIMTGSLNGDIALLVTNKNSDVTTAFSVDIALLNMTMT